MSNECKAGTEVIHFWSGAQRVEFAKPMLILIMVAMHSVSCTLLHKCTPKESSWLKYEWGSCLGSFWFQTMCI